MLITCVEPVSQKKAHTEMETEMETDGNKQAGRAGKIKLRRADDPLFSEQALVNGPEGSNPPPRY